MCSHWPGDGKGIMEGGSTVVDGEGMHWKWGVKAPGG